MYQSLSGKKARHWRKVVASYARRSGEQVRTLKFPLRNPELSPIDFRKVSGLYNTTEGIGAANTELLSGLAARQSVWLNRDQLSTLVGASWEVEASLEVSADSEGELRLLNLNFVNDKTFFNFSCCESGN
jgi:hypothetical protein